MELTTQKLSDIFIRPEATEMSYVDLLSKLKADVKSDLIPDDEKRKILRSVAQLEAMLWKYSY